MNSVIDLLSTYIAALFYSTHVVIIFLYTCVSARKAYK
jgi:hypothetical protein